MGDAAAGLHDGFRERIDVLLDRRKEQLAQLSYEEARQLGIQGADTALAPLIWSGAVGERWSTTTVTELLYVTRQAVHKRVLNGTLLGLPGRGTTWFPVWQFDLNTHEVRAVVAEIISAFREELGSVDPLVIASWATTDQPELGMSPEEWLSAGKDPTDLVPVARRASSALAR